ncbi:uncharacterized protein F5891DRAFT_976694 [Suillus fuscotomentosus]|uniref:Uncharacterized protein n=1 Tax=Suillus fuscotomentosus TaxID=1912939 RepID=A0AAD4EFG0_9AGAM|nr:uncharacterized protein F5891DRAFT_976694 [Suillus fuscotomentosus]KAG1905152.1 hypothetical protein F5891DRAFT_976694 [Suillus fuscotomentosus]
MADAVIQLTGPLVLGYQFNWGLYGVLATQLFIVMSDLAGKPHGVEIDCNVKSPYIIRSNPALVREIFGDEQETTKQSVLAAAKWRSMMGPDMGKGRLGGTERWHAGWALWVSRRHLAVV